MSLRKRSAPGVPRRTSGRTVSKATSERSEACMRKADRVRRPSTKEPTMNAVLGIDIAKAKFQVSLLWADGRRRRKAFANTRRRLCRAPRLADPTRGGPGPCLPGSHRHVWGARGHDLVRCRTSGQPSEPGDHLPLRQESAGARENRSGGRGSHRRLWRQRTAGAVEACAARASRIAGAGAPPGRPDRDAHRRTEPGTGRLAHGPRARLD